jgi:hypothetical protein
LYRAVPVLIDVHVCAVDTVSVVLSTTDVPKLTPIHTNFLRGKLAKRFPCRTSATD